MWWACHKQGIMAARGTTTSCCISLVLVLSTSQDGPETATCYGLSGAAALCIDSCQCIAETAPNKHHTGMRPGTVICNFSLVSAVM